MSASEKDQGKHLVVFVHGLGANRGKWWGATITSVSTHPSLEHATVEFWGYETSHGALGWIRNIMNAVGMGSKRQTIEQLGQHVWSDLRHMWQQKKYVSLSLVGHSMGGLVLAAALGQDQRDATDDSLHTSLANLVLIASPLGGADLADLGKKILQPMGGNIHVDDLRPNSPTRRAVISRFVNRMFCSGTTPKFRLAILRAANDAVVEQSQLTEPLPEIQGEKNWYTYEVLDGTHSGCIQNLDTSNPNLHKIISLITPSSQNEQHADDHALDKLRTKAFEQFDLTDPRAETTPLEEFETPSIERFKFRGGNTELSSRYPIVGFDVDGTLLRGLEFSWTRVWDYLEFPPEIRETGMARFLRKEDDYYEWCKWACKHFRGRKLSRDQFTDIAHGITTTKNLREALSFLRNDGRMIVAVSGGIDAFLTECIPDAEELFDYIFINRFHFDDLNFVVDVEPTPFDFGGKAVVLRRLAETYGLGMKDVAFVGEGFNDGAAARAAGISIAYPPIAQSVFRTTKYQVETDDLNILLKYL